LITERSLIEEGGARANWASVDEGLRFLEYVIAVVEDTVEVEGG
jgi:hypothetical protein